MRYCCLARHRVCTRHRTAQRQPGPGPDRGYPTAPAAPGWRCCFAPCWARPVPMPAGRTVTGWRQRSPGCRWMRRAHWKGWVPAGLRRCQTAGRQRPARPGCRSCCRRCGSPPTKRPRRCCGTVRCRAGPTSAPARPPFLPCWTAWARQHRHRRPRCLGRRAWQAQIWIARCSPRTCGCGACLAPMNRPSPAMVSNPQARWCWMSRYVASPSLHAWRRPRLTGGQAGPCWIRPAKPPARRPGLRSGRGSTPTARGGWRWLDRPSAWRYSVSSPAH